MRLQNRLDEADIAIQASMERLKEVPVQLKAAQDAFSQKTAQYNAGIADIAELTNVSYLLYSAEASQVQARTDLLHTLLEKAVTNNTLTDFINRFNH